MITFVEIQDQEFFKLSDIQDRPESGVFLKNFGCTYAYHAVLTPTERRSPYYSIHYTEDLSDQWKTLPGLLSSSYIVANAEKILEGIKETVGGNIDVLELKKDPGLVKTIFISDNHFIGSEEIPANERLLFNLLSGVDISKTANKKYISFSLINGYFGNYSLSLNYGLLTSIEDSESRQKIETFHNSLIFGQFMSRMVHVTYNEDIGKDIADVQSGYLKAIDKYKSISVSDEFWRDFRKICTKTFFEPIYECFLKLPDNVQFRNFYYLSYIISYFLDSLALNQEIRTRNWFGKYLFDHFK